MADGIWGTASLTGSINIHFIQYLYSHLVRSTVVSASVSSPCYIEIMFCPCCCLIYTALLKLSVLVDLPHTGIIFNKTCTWLISVFEPESCEMRLQKNTFTSLKRTTENNRNLPGEGMIGVLSNNIDQRVKKMIWLHTEDHSCCSSLYAVSGRIYNQHLLFSKISLF